MTYDEELPKTTILKKESKVETPINSKVLSLKPRKAPAVLAKTTPLTISFSEGALAGTFRFVKAGDTYQDNMGKIQRYGVTKIVIKTTSMKDPFTFTEPLFRYFMAAVREDEALEKMSEWDELE